MGRHLFQSPVILPGIFLAAALAACSSDPAPATDAGVTPTDTGVAPTDTGVAPTDTGVAPTDTGVAPTDTGVAPTDGGAGTDASSTAMVVGTVSLNDMPVANATVAVVGGTTPSVMTGADGAYSFTFPIGSTQVLRASAANARTVQSALVVAGAGEANFKFGLISAADLRAAYTELGVTEDTTKGLLLMHFTVPGMRSAQPGGFGATLSASAGGTFFVVSSSGPARQAVTSAGDDTLGVANVSAGTVTVTPVLPAGHTCTARYGLTSFRVDAQNITEVYFDCT